MEDILKESCNALAQGLADGLDALILSALKKRFGVVALDDLKGRLHRTIFLAHNDVEVFDFDGVPFLEVHPLETEFDGHTITTTRKYRELK